MSLVDLVAPPSRIPAPRGVPVREFDEAKIGQLVTGVVLAVKERRAWRSTPGTTIRQPIRVLSVTLQVSPREVIKIYVAAGLRLKAGDVVEVPVCEEVLDGQSVLYGDTGRGVTPPVEGKR